MGTDKAAEFIADYIKELIVLAEGAGKESLAYTLKIAEIEARNVLKCKKEK
jgi:hypothetical protein